MGKQEATQTEKVLSIGIVLSLVFLCIYVLPGIYSFTFFPDEFGYWSSAAGNLSYDWSKVASIGSYYSFGYSFILTPILFLFEDSIMAYRAAVVVNLILQIVAFYLLKDIYKNVFGNSINSLVKTLLAGMTVLYPSWVFYTQTTMAEATIFFMYVLILWLMMRFIDRPSPVKGIFLGAAAVYIYTVHMRSIGVLIAVAVMILVNLLWTIRKDDDKINIAVSSILIVIVIAVGFVAADIIKKDIIANVFSSGDVIRTDINDYGGQTGKIAELLTLTGIGKFFLSLFGKLLYLGCSSFGTAYIGIYALVKKSIKKDRNAMFVLIASFLEYMVMCIYLLHSADVTQKRFDLFLHGRYCDFIVPILMAYGVAELLTDGKHIKKMLIAAGTLIVFSVLSLIICSRNTVGMSDPHATLMLGMSYFLDDENVRPFYTIILSTIFTLIVGAVLTAVIDFCKKKNKYVYLIVFPLILGILGYLVSERFIYKIQSNTFGDVQMADAISDLRNDGNNSEVVVLYVGGLEYADTIQHRLRDEKISVIYVDKGIIGNQDQMVAFADELSLDKLYLISFDNPLSEVLEEKFDHNWELGHFDLYYN